MSPNPPNNVLLGVTGSIGAALAVVTVYALRAVWSADVRVIMTPAAERFATPDALAVASRHPVTTAQSLARDGRVEHIELTRWADLVMIAPTTANTLSTLARGAATDALSTAVLAAPGPVVLVPSMNNCMWTKPAVQRNVSTLRADGFGVMDPVRGPAAIDGVSDVGSMAHVGEVLDWTLTWLAPLSYTAETASAHVA